MPVFRSTAIKWQIGACQQLGLPYKLVCTYDIPNFQQYPTTTFNSFIHLAAMKAGMALATLFNDSTTYDAASAAFTRGAAAIPDLLWNSTYSYLRAYTTGDAIMSDCLYGQMLALERGFGFAVNTSYLSSHLAAEVKYNANPYGFTMLTGRASPPPMLDELNASPRVKAALAAQANLTGLTNSNDDTNWQGAAPTWSYIALALGEMSVEDALEPTRLSVENFRTRLADWWNIVGLTTSGDWGDDNQNGMPYCTSHYGFLLPNYHLLYALTGQMTDIASGKLSFAPRYACPYTLPLLLAGTTGTIACSGTSSYTVTISFGGLSLPAGGLSISGSTYANAVALGPGGSVSW